MINLRWLLAIPVVLAATLVAAPADAADRPRPAQGCSVKRSSRRHKPQLDQLERATHIPIVIETIDAIPGLDADASAAEKQEGDRCAWRSSATSDP